MTNRLHYSPDQIPSLPASYGSVLLAWQAPEHEPLELGPRSRVIVTVLLVFIIAYALFTNSALMAITFILIGVLGYLALHREPRILDFFLTSKGIVAGDQFYEYEAVHSFWIYEEPPFEDLLSLHTTGTLLPYAHIPVITVDRHTLRETLLDFVPEGKHEPRFVDTLERLLHI